MNYKLTHSDAIIRTDDNTVIPAEPTLYDYQHYLNWLAEGNTPEPADPLPEPTPLTPLQKLEASGLTVPELKELLGLT